MTWKAEKEALGYTVVEITHGGARVLFALSPTEILRKTLRGQVPVHEAYRSLLTSVASGWTPGPEYHTQMTAVCAPVVTPDAKWHGNQVDDVSVFTENSVVHDLLSPFFNVDVPRERASIILVDTQEIVTDAEVAFGRVFRFNTSPQGYVQVWDARLGFPMPDSAESVRPVVLAHILAVLVYNHVVHFGLENSFVEVHPQTLNVVRMYHGPVTLPQRDPDGQ